MVSRALEKAGNKLLLVQPNLKFRAITDNDLEKKSVEQAFAKSVLFGFKIVEESTGKYIIAKKRYYHEGRVEVTSRGNAYVICDDLGARRHAVDP